MTKVSVKEALDKLYDLSWMIGSTAMEYLTDKDGEKIRDYIGVIEDRIDDLEKEWCCTCENYIPVDESLPGFITAYPECKRGGSALETCESYKSDRRSKSYKIDGRSSK